jgi:hypothetical protein
MFLPVFFSSAPSSIVEQPRHERSLVSCGWTGPTIQSLRLRLRLPEAVTKHKMRVAPATQQPTTISSACLSSLAEQPRIQSKATSWPNARQRSATEVQTSRKKAGERKRKTSFQSSEAKRTGGWIDVFWLLCYLAIDLLPRSRSRY